MIQQCWLHCNLQEIFKCWRFSQEHLSPCPTVSTSSHNGSTWTHWTHWTHYCAGTTHLEMGLGLAYTMTTNKSVPSPTRPINSCPVSSPFHPAHLWASFATDMPAPCTAISTLQCFCSSQWLVEYPFFRCYPNLWFIMIIRNNKNAKKEVSLNLINT